MWSPVSNPLLSPVNFYEEASPVVTKKNFDFLDFDNIQPLICQEISTTNQKMFTMENLHQKTNNHGFGEIEFSGLPSSGEESVDILDFLARLEGNSTTSDSSQFIQLAFQADPDSGVEIKLGENLLEIEVEEEDFGSNYGFACEDNFFSAISDFKTESQKPLNLEELLQEKRLEDSFQSTLSSTSSSSAKKSLSGQRQAKAPRPSKLSLQESFDKNSPEYFKKRERNNESVRKSRDKARQKQQETEERVQGLSSENQRLQTRVTDLERELSILKGLFANVGVVISQELKAATPS